MRENMIASNPDSASESPDKIAQEVIKYLEDVANQAQRTSEKTTKQLEGICMPRTLNIEKDEEGEEKPEKKYPPYFHILRDQLQCIELSLLRINNTLDRCEI